MPHPTYGSVEGDATTEMLVRGSERNPSLGRSGSWPSRNATASEGLSQQHRLGQRWRNFAATGALAIGTAAVFALAYNGQPSNTGGSLLDAVGPKIEGTSPSPPVQHVARSFPKPSILPPTLPASAPAATAAGEEVGPLSFEATNFYHVRDGKPALDYPWLKDVKLIEPYRETTLSVSFPRDGYEYIWEVHGGEADKADVRATASGAEAVVVLTILDENMITIKEVNSEGQVVRRLDEMVMVKYVRREIRTLTDDDREELLDAMFTMWEIRADDGNGKELYGEDYADIYGISRLHFLAAMNKTCDHFHDGVGFVTSHSLITNTFEYSLQLVNPKLTLPYWDWTIDELEATNSGDDDELIINPPLFQESWFGSADPNDHVVKDGRWAFSEIPTTFNGNPGDVIPDVYERQRSRWVVNSSPYLTRGLGEMCDGVITDLADFPFPTCSTHLSLVTDYPDFLSWSWDSMYLPHGPVHSWIGGVVNCEDTVNRLTNLIGKENTDSLGLYEFDQRKGFWIDGYFECDGSAPDSASEEDIMSSGQCGCLGYDLSQGDDWRTVYNNSRTDFNDVIKDYDDDTKRAVVEAVCSSSIVFGDQIHAGSSYDPTFWPMHPTMERLFMFSVLTGQVTDMSWPDTSAASSDEELSVYGYTCDGHGGDDVFPFGLLDDDPDGFKVKTGIKGNVEIGNNMTNREVLAALDARVNMLPYVYDNFKWNHCLDAGVDFNDAWNTTSSTANKSRNTSDKNSHRSSSNNHDAFSK